MTISASNEGFDGAFFFGSGSSGKNVLGVASIEANETLAMEGPIEYI